MLDFYRFGQRWQEKVTLSLTVVAVVLTLRVLGLWVE